MVSKAIKQIHQIEVTSRCNLRCVYCPSPNLGRPKVDITDQQFEAAIEWTLYYQRQGTQGELNLAGIGESTLHPKFVEYVKYARGILGPKQRLLIATNGLLLTDELCAQLQPYNLRIWVSMHRPEKAVYAIEAAKKYGLFESAAVDAATNPVDWAGQVDWPVDQRLTDTKRPCDWLRNGMVMVMADGRITSCCLDASGVGVVGTIEDDLTTLQTKPYKLCETCYFSSDV